MSQPKLGSIIGFSGKDWQCDLINVCSLGIPRYSIHHVGLMGSLHGELLLYESKGMGDAESPTAKCARAGQRVNGVQAHKFQEILDNAKDTRIWHYPLRRELYEHEAERLSWLLDNKLGVRYDLTGALETGGYLTRFLAAQLREEDTSQLFCSELVCDVLVETGLFHTDNVSKWSPNRLLRELIAAGIYGKPTLLKDC